MSDYAYVADRAKKAFAAVSKLENALARSPGDNGLHINLISMRRMADQARQEMERLAAINSIEICNYRLVPIDDSYSLEHVSKSFLNYQYLFSQIYDSYKNGPKLKAILNKISKIESTLEFGYTYSGSLGVVLLAKSERDFFNGTLDKPIETLYQILNIEDVDDVRDVARTLGRAVVKRIYDWSSANAEGGFSADVRWTRSDGRVLGQMVDRTRLADIAGYVKSTSEKSSNKIDIVGILLGASLSSRTFHLVIPNGDSFLGHLAEDIVLPSEVTLGRTYKAEIEITETYQYATENSVKINTLRTLTPV